MNRFHGIQQDRESLYVPSFSDDAASASSYEGDADDDSFETAGHLSHNKKLPDFGQDSITRSRAKRQKIQDQQLSDPFERDCDITQENCANGREVASSTGTAKERHKFQKDTTKKNADFYEKFLSSSVTSDDKYSSAGLGIEVVQQKNAIIRAKSEAAYPNAKEGTCTATESASPKSIVSIDPSSITRLLSHHSIDLPPKVKRNMPRSGSLPFMPSSENFLLSDDLSSSSEIYRTRKETNDLSELLTILSPPSLVSSHSSMSSSVSTAIPREPSDCSSIATVSKSKRLGEIRSRLRKIESQYRSSTSRSMSSTFLGSPSERIMKSSTSCSTMQSTSVLHRIVREVLFVSFIAFLIYVKYLTHRDAQSNATQLQLTQIQFAERSIELANNTKLCSIPIHPVETPFATALESKVQKSDYPRLSEETPQLLNKERLSLLSLSVEDRLITPHVALTLIPNHLIELAAPNPSNKIQDLRETIEMPVESLQRNINIMNEFYYIQSMLD